MTPKKTRRKVAVQKSIFTRYLAITMGIVVLSFIMLGTVMMAFFSQYWKNEKRDLLTQNAASIAEMSNAFLSKTSEDTYQLQTTVLKTFIDAFSTSIDADIFITDLEGNILLGNYPNSKLSQPQSVPQQTVSLAAQGMYEGRNTFGGLYRSPSFIIGVPMYAGENKDMCVGAVFAATSVSTVSAFQGEALQMFLVAAAAALGITFIVVGAFAYRLVQPLRQMSAAARTFGGGDFSVRVPVTSADELGQLALSFNNMANSLSNSEGTRRSFIANVSHELKTPLAVIQNYGTMLQQPGLSEEKCLEYAKAVTDASRRLANLITNILKLNKLENQQIFPQAETYDLGEQLCQCLLAFENAWEEKGLDIQTDIQEDVLVEADSELLSLVWNNLFSNAVKFTEPGGTLSLTLEVQEDLAVVRVGDTGCGIPPEVGRHIFEKFYQGDTSHATQGNGLGLALVKRVMDIVGGDISVESQVGVGSVFTVKLRRKRDGLEETAS